MTSAKKRAKKGSNMIPINNTNPSGMPASIRKQTSSIPYNSMSTAYLKKSTGTLNSNRGRSSDSKCKNISL